MKKRIAVILSALLLIGILLELYLPMITPKKFFKTGNDDGIKSVSVFCGATGDRFEVTEADEVDGIISLIGEERLYRSTLFPIHEDGFTYSVTFINEKGEREEYLRIKCDFIDANGYQYKRRGEDGYSLPIYEFLAELEAKYILR